MRLQAPIGISILLLVSLASSPTHAQPTTRLTRALPGLDSVAGEVEVTSFSDDARFVALTSDASNLVTGDVNLDDDVFVLDMLTGTVVCASVTPQGKSGNRASQFGKLSGNGRFLVFESLATDLVASDDNGRSDVFLRDLWTGTTTLISASPSGSSGNHESIRPEISRDARVVVFTSPASDLVPGDTNGKIDVFAWERLTGATSRLNVGLGGAQANDNSFRASVSADGSIVAYQSFASNLVAADTNSASDIFVLDRALGVTTRVSVSSTGVQGDGSSLTGLGTFLSNNGRFVAFGSDATNLVPNDTNGQSDVFVHDRLTAQTTRVSVDSFGNEGNGRWMQRLVISADGSRVLFTSDSRNLVPNDTNSVADCYVHDRNTATTQRVNLDANGGQDIYASRTGALTPDGSRAAFSSAQNLSGEPSFAPRPHAFIRDLALQTTRILPLAAILDEPNGASSKPIVSGDGRFLAFESTASNLTPNDGNLHSDVFVTSLDSGVTERISISTSGGDSNGHSQLGGLSADGRFVTFSSRATNLVPGDTNIRSDVFLFDRLTRITSRVSVSNGGAEANSDSLNPVISADGRWIAFSSTATNLSPALTQGKSHVYVFDRQLGQLYLTSVKSNGVTFDADLPAISANGRFLAMLSVDPVLPGDLPNTPDVYVQDLQTGAITWASQPGPVRQGEGPSLSADGRLVAFSSGADNLVPGDLNNREDVFVRDLVAGTTRRVSVSSSGAEANGNSNSARLSADGRSVAFSSGASNLVDGDTAGELDAFVHFLQTGETIRVNVDSAGREAQDSFVYGALRVRDVALSSDSRFAVFSSLSPQLDAPDANGQYDIFVRDMIRLGLSGTPQVGQPVSFQLEGAIGELGNLAAIVLSCTGIGGVPLPGDGRVLYLTPDACTNLSLGAFAPLLQAPIDAAGQAQTPPVIVPPALSGQTLFAAAVTIDLGLGQFASLTSPIEIQVQ